MQVLIIATKTRNNSRRIIEHGHEAKPSILWLQIVYLAARRDYDDYDCYRARQELEL